MAGAEEKAAPVCHNRPETCFPGEESPPPPFLEYRSGFNGDVSSSVSFSGNLRPGKRLFLKGLARAGPGTRNRAASRIIGTKELIVGAGALVNNSSQFPRCQVCYGAPFVLIRTAR